MSSSFVPYLPIVTTIPAIPFAVAIGRRYAQHPERLHLLRWAIGVGAYAAVWSSPIQYELVESHRLTGRVFAWTWVRRFSPFINLYAVIFLVGGAMLPGIGGMFTRFGYTEILYGMELLGLLMMRRGYVISVRN